MRSYFTTLAAIVALGSSLLSPHANAAVGRTPGQFSVSQNGSASYTIPIWTPPGPKGIQPSLALAYDSRNGGGMLGYGWKLAGLSSIIRCNRTVAQSGAPAAVTLTSSDTFCLDGKFLRLTGGTYGQAGSTYQTEIANFSNVTAYGGIGSGPAYFIVQGRDGLTYEYGYNGNSAVMAGSSASAWMLDKISDRAGNRVVIDYVAPNGLLTGATVPNRISWTASSAGANTFNYAVQFNYGTNLSQTSIYGFVAGTSVVNAQLLNSITVSSSGSAVRHYALTYENSPTTSGKRLTQVRECADTAQTNCLSPTAISYQNGQAGVASGASSAITLQSPSIGHDVNADGYSDLVYYESPGIKVRFGSSSGYGSPISLPATGSFTVGDLLGTGQDGILAEHIGNWYYFIWNSATSSFAQVNAGTHGGGLADVNGDGLPDLITVGSNAWNGYLEIYAGTNTSTTGSLSFNGGSMLHQIWHTGYTVVTVATPDSGVYGPLRRFDFNGDGRDDLGLFITDCSSWRWEGDVLVCDAFSEWIYQMVLTPTGATVTLVDSYPVGSTQYQPYLVDWNNDACTDLIANNIVRISNCNGGWAATFTASGAVKGTMDWDGDGRTDLLVNAGGGVLSVQLSTGNGLSGVIPTSLGFDFTKEYQAFDADGDGLDDLAEIGFSGVNRTFAWHTHNSVGVPPDLLSSVSDGFGLYFNPSYISMVRGAYQKYTDGAYPDRDFIGPMYVVNQLGASDGAGGSFSQSFAYYGARYNEQGRGFTGLYAKRTYDSRNGQYGYEYYRRDFPYAGLLFQSDTYQSDGATLIRRIQNTFEKIDLDATPNNQRTFPYIKTTTLQQYELGGTKNGQLITTGVTTYTYDSYGNATTVANAMTDNDTGSPYYGQQWTSTTTANVAPNTSNWCLSVPTQSSVTNTAPGVPTITRTMSFGPDYVNCRINWRTTAPGDSTYQVAETYGYDSFGNVNSVSVTGAGMAARSTSMNWGTTGQFPTSVTNALSQTTTQGYDYNLGVQSSLTDPNGIATSWQYDAFGRRSRENKPDGTYTTWTWNTCPTSCPSPGDLKYWIQESQRDTGGGSVHEGRVFYDALDRVRFDQEQLLNGSYTYSVHRGYDSFGRTVLDYVPSSSETASYHFLAYDGLGRPTSDSLIVNGATSRQTTVQYAGRSTTVTDAENKSTTKIATVAGQMGRSADHSGYYQNFTYDAFGSLKTVTDSLGNTLLSATYDYGIGAFQRTQSDPDLGNRAYAYNALGELTAGTDAKSQSFGMAYDALSRPVTRTEAEGTSVWTWGTSSAARNIGQLASVSSPGFAQSFTYDTIGRVSNKQIVTDATYAYDYAYNSATGYLDSLTYPTSTSSYRLKLQYIYQYGALQQVKDWNSATVFWQASSMNARGQITQEALGNGIVTSRAFDANTGHLSSITSGVGGGATLQNESYLFDLVGNLTQRQNNNAGLTESFYYDNLHRLDHSARNGVTNLSLTYDAMGNITSRSDVAGGAAWTYHATKKHAVTQAGSASYTYTYDANGNAMTRNGYSITWSSYNYPTVINGANKSMTFTYDANRNRIRQVYTNGSTMETTQYIDRILEKVTTGAGTDWRHYVRVGDQIVAVVSRKSSGTNATHYILEDHQHSASRITNSSGASVVGESFTAFGQRRDAGTWQGPCPCTDLQTIAAVTRKGYTGHDAIGGASMGLIHMNGRVQDAITGRFLSADPYLTSPGNTQNYNRYSYVSNNPLSYTDPSGFDDESLAEVIISSMFSGTTMVDYFLQLWRIGLEYSNGGLIVADGGGGGDGGGGEQAPKGDDLPPQRERKPTQCMNENGTVGNDNPGTISEPNVLFGSLDAEGYVMFGVGFHLGGFYDRSTKNYGAFFAFDLGAGLGASAGASGGVAKDLSSFQGAVSVIGAGVGLVSANYASQLETPSKPVAISAGLGVNAMPPLPVPASVHSSKSYTKLFATSLPPCET